MDGLNSPESQAYRCNEFSMVEIHNILLGVVNANARSSLSRLHMAEIIWPERNEEIRAWIDARNPEKLPGALQKSGMTFELWMKMDNIEAQAYQCYGLSIREIHTILLKVVNRHATGVLPRLHMAKIIWPERGEEITRMIQEKS